MARAQSPWRCSQCGAINEAGSRACHDCGKWPSLFDLQDSVEPQEVEQAEMLEPDLFEAETFEPETFEPEPYETGMPAETIDPEDEEEDAGERRSRFPRWAITALWVAGLVIWFVVNALGDRG